MDGSHQSESENLGTSTPPDYWRLKKENERFREEIRELQEKLAESKGICGPSAILAIALIPAMITRAKRTK